MNNRFVFFDENGQRLKKIKVIFFILTTAVILSLLLSLNIFTKPLRQKNINRKYDEIKASIDEISTRKKDLIEIEGDGPIITIDEKDGHKYLVRKPWKNSKQIILTFDDGPDPNFTPKVLDILDKEKVKAVFFLVGEQMMRHPDIAKQIVARGHVIGNHTFSHPHEEDDLYKRFIDNPEKLNLEFDLTDKIIIAQTGVKSNIFRIPYLGTENDITLNNLVLATLSNYKGYTPVAVTSDSFDWRDDDPKQITENAVKTEGSQIILMHDSGGERKPTLDALPQIINNYKANGYQFVTTESLDNSGNPAIENPNSIEKFNALFSYKILWLKYYYPDVLKNLFISGLGVVGLNSLIIISFALLQLFVTQFRYKKNIKPYVSIIIPAFNEEKTIAKTIKSVLSSNYKKYEILAINNNSTDRTASVLRTFKKNKKVKILTEKIQGKFAALNRGVLSARGEIVVIIDADTQLARDALENIVKPFSDRKTGGVSGNVKVGNSNNLLTTYQSIEYTVGLNLDRRAYDLFSSASVIPGALGAWRKKAVIKAGMFTNDTLVEDADMAIKIQKLGFKTAYVGAAVGFTEAPENIAALIKQRKRWTFGIMQVLYKNRRFFFKKKSGFLGFFILPYMAFLQFPTMAIAPLVDLLSVITFVFNPIKVVAFFYLFLIIKSSEVFTAFVIARERRLQYLLHLPTMRIIYQFFWYKNLYSCIFTMFKGEYLPWNKLTHFGKVELEKVVAKSESFS